MKYLPFFTLLLSMVYSIPNSNAQVKALVNGVATDVEHKNGTITAMNDSFPDYMNGFEKPPYDMFQKVRPRLETNAYAESDKPQPVIVAETEKEPTLKDIERLDRQRAKKNNAIYFKDNAATIRPVSNKKLMYFSEKIKNGSSKSVLLKAWYELDNLESQELIKERLEMCKQEMEEQGVPSNLILTSILGSSKESKFVTVLMQ